MRSCAMVEGWEGGKSPSSPRAMVFVFYYPSPMLEGAILLAVVMHPR